MALLDVFKSKEKRNNSLENPSIPLSAAFLSLGAGNYTDSNERVSEQSSLQVPTVLACTRIISEGIGSLPLRIYEKLDRGQRPASAHPLYYLLSQEPNPEATAVTFFTTLATHSVLWQNAYAEIERNKNGQPLALWVRVPWRTSPVRVNGRLMFKTTDTPNGAERLIDAADMLHFVGFSLDALTGTSLVMQARQSIGLALVAARFGARYYANGARPSIILQPEAPMSPEDMANLRLDMEALSTGANVHRVAALSNGIKIDQIKIDPAASEYIATRKFEREEIAAFFRVPGYMVGATDKALKATIEAQNMEFLTYTLRPWLERFEQELQRKLLPPVGRNSGKYAVHFYTDALLSVDKSTRTSCYTQGRNGGWLSINDVREMEGMETIPGGDTYIQPLNYENVATATEGVETDDEPEDTTPNDTTDTGDDTATVAKARSLYEPMFTDALNRLSNRSKKDKDTISKTLLPVINSLATYFRNNNTAGNNEAESINIRII